ncbi:TGS domain-containing protein, partial [Paenibacillus sp. MCAF20]
MPDQAIRRYQQGTTLAAIAASISSSVGKNAVAGKIDGKLVDLNHPIVQDC